MNDRFVVDTDRALTLINNAMQQPRLLGGGRVVPFRSSTTAATGSRLGGLGRRWPQEVEQ